MSVAYTALNQGQGDDRRTEPTPTTDAHSSSSNAPMAKAEGDTDSNDEEVHRITSNASNNEAIPTNSIANNGTVTRPNVPHIEVTKVDEIKSNNVEEDHPDGSLGNDLDDGDTALHLRDFRTGTPHSSVGRVPHLGLNFDTELGSIAGETIPDINVYQHKKTLAQGMMDLALFSANANQLRYVLDSYSRHPYYWPSVVCIVLSLGLQVSIGIGLIWNALYDVKDAKEICIANKINNFTVIGIFLVVVVNVFISGFGVADPMPVTAVAAVGVGIGLIWNSLYNVRDEKDLHFANKINNFTVIGIFLVVVLNVFVSAFGVTSPMEVLIQVPAVTPAAPMQIVTLSGL